MFNSSKITNSSRLNTDLHGSIHETANGMPRSFIQPKLTSTPLVKRESIFATPPKHSILSSKRYSLSEIATPPRTIRRDFSKVNNTIGPLLTSTKYNVNVSTYEDTKSPGLASRIVQYNEEAEQEKGRTRPPTHQAKYGSPGLFPIVHLFKKDLPTLEQKTKKVTIRVASPEYSKHHSQEYNRKLLEGIVKPSLQINRGNSFSPGNQSNSSTRSVLDALKEISRKRLHTSEEYDMNEENGKRFRMNTNDTNKRVRDDSSLEKSLSPDKPTSKKICMYDEYAASCSSTDFSFMNTNQPKRKSISISTLTENPKEVKQVKLINAETQTITNDTLKTSEPVPVSSKEDEQNDTQTVESDQDKNGMLKIFDDAPLERIRKNRLAALMGSLTGKDPVLLPKPDYIDVLSSASDGSDVTDTPVTEAAKSTEKPLVSILSSPRKLSPTKSNKHVHFSVPESTSQTEIVTTNSVTSFPTISTSVVTPISSTSEIKLTFAPTSKETPTPPSSSTGTQLNSTSISTSFPAASFGTPSVADSSTSLVSKESSVASFMETPKTNLAIASFQFKPPTPSTTSVAPASDQLTFTVPKPVMSTASSSASTPPKIGGFKFDLSKSAATSSIKSAPTFNFGAAMNTNKVNSGTEPPVKSLTNSPSSTAGTFSFGANTSTTADSNKIISLAPNFSSGTTVSTTSAVASVTPTFKFGSASKESKASGGFSLGQNNSTFNAPAVTTSTSVFGANVLSTSLVSTSTTTSASGFNSNAKAPFFSFGSPKTPGFSTSVTSAAPGFGSGNTTSTTTATVGFGTSTSTPSFGTSTATPSFGTSTATPSFGTSTPAPSFGSGSAPSTGGFLNTSAPLPAASFGTVTTTSTVSTGFGAPSTANSISFGTNAAPIFSAGKTAPFGVSTSTTPTFGTQPEANASPFGKSNTPQFGQSTTQSTFGTPTTTVSFGTSGGFSGTSTTASSSVFGNSSNTSVFANKTGGFGAPSGNSNIFGGVVNTQPSGFGVTTSKPIFGSTTTPFGTNTKTTTTTTSFGTNSTPSFSFGAKTTASAFGGGNAFGSTTTTTASAGFGTTPTPAFGSSNSFGNPTNLASANTFGGSTAPSFGIATTTTTSGFGNTNTMTFGGANAGFNSGEKTSTFGNSVAPAFGNASSSFANASSTPSFGSTNSTPAFGTSTGGSAFAKPQATQNAFGAPSSNAFGTGNTFGTPAQPPPPSFGTNPSNTQNAVFSFGATTTPKPSGVFSFGASGSNEVPKPSFNFTGGNATPSFGSSGTSSFGSTGPASFSAPGVPQFNAPQTGAQGMFSIGSGSSSGKSRTLLKPKRRT